MKSIKNRNSLLVFLISFIVIVEISLSVLATHNNRETFSDIDGIQIDYCEIERKFCLTDHKSHVACNSNLINDEDEVPAKKVFTGRIFNLSHIQTNGIVKKINIFRNNLAKGKVNNFENTASRMRLVDWSPEFQHLAKLSIQQSPSGDNLGCTSTAEFPETQIINYKINYYPHNELRNHDVGVIFKEIIQHFVGGNENSSALGSDDAHRIGCAIARQNNGVLIVRCILNKNPNHNVDDGIYKIGRPCGDCDAIGAFCDLSFPGLCTTGLSLQTNSRVRRQAHASDSSVHKALYDNDDTSESVQTMKDYGDSCVKVEECNYPLICMEEDDSGDKSCTCDEAYYYYDSVLGTCLLDGYELVRNFYDELPNRTDLHEKLKPILNQSEKNKPHNFEPESHVRKVTVTDSTPTKSSTDRVGVSNDGSPETSKERIYIEKENKNDTLIIIVVTCVLFVITWVILIVTTQRVQNSIDRKLGDVRRFTDSKL